MKDIYMQRYTKNMYVDDDDEVYNVYTFLSFE